MASLDVARAQQWHPSYAGALRGETASVVVVVFAIIATAVLAYTALAALTSARPFAGSVDISDALAKSGFSP